MGKRRDENKAKWGGRVSTKGGRKLRESAGRRAAAGPSM